jgi:Mn2+/Fe2+ NRAMP family transporter
MGLSRSGVEARAFYAATAGATLVGNGIAFSPLDPIKVLFRSAVINGVVAPLIAAMAVPGALPSAMGSLVLPMWLRVLGWLSAPLMAVGTESGQAPAMRRRCRLPPAHPAGGGRVGKLPSDR